MNDTINRLRENKLKAYKADPGLIKEHFGIEESVLAGSYGYRQVLELVQNGADAILEALEGGQEQVGRTRIEVMLADSYLYVANTGRAFSEDGIDAILRSHSSPKRGNQIGRFGLGFKSLLRLGGKIDITSGPVAFGFDPLRCRQELQSLFAVKDVPGLRLAWTLADERAALLRAKFPWATTVVCAEIRADGFIDHLRSEIQKFPSEFLLFLPVPVTLTLDDGSGAKRELYRKEDGDDQLLHDGESLARWRVASKQVCITDQRAKDDATHIHIRDSVPLAWAVPLDAKREEKRRFWAFFPTQTETRVSGILNAPWKLDSERNALIGGEWNTVLMQEAAQLIVETLPQLSINDDPGRLLDAFPRQLERQDEVAAALVKFIWLGIEKTAVIPDAMGELRFAHELLRHPRDGAEIAKQWLALASVGVAKQLIHPTCLERQRGSRLEVLSSRLNPVGAEKPLKPNLRKAGEASWFAVVASSDTRKAAQVLRLAESFAKDCKLAEWEPTRLTLRVIPSEQGSLLTSNQAVFAPPGSLLPNGRHLISHELCAEPEVKRILAEVLKVKPLDESVWEQVLSEGLPDFTGSQYFPDEQWRSIWERLHSVPSNICQRFVLQNRKRIRVRRRDDKWVPPDEVILPGALVGSDDISANKNVLVDMQVHGMDRDLLVMLGVVEFPDEVVAVNEYDDLNEWLSYWRSHYQQNVNGRASWEYLIPAGLKLPNGWNLFPKLINAANEKLTGRFLERLNQGDFPKTQSFGHRSVLTYPKIDVPHPLLWLLLKYGKMSIEGVSVSLASVVGCQCGSTLNKLTNGTQIRAAVERLKDVIPPVIPVLADIHAFWQALIKALALPEALMDDSLSELWSGAAKDGVVPISLPAGPRDVPIAEIFVTGSSDLAHHARKAGHVVVVLESEALKLWIDRGAHDLADLMKPQWAELAGPACLLSSILPELADIMRDETKERAYCQPVIGLQLFIAGHSTLIPCLIWDNTLLLDLTQLMKLSRSDRIMLLVNEIAGTGWLRYQVREALGMLGDEQLDKLRATVASGSTLAERLLLAVGRRAEPLCHVLGTIGNLDIIQECDPLKLADLTLAQLGPATLALLKETLVAEGLKPPSRWSSAEARAFVASIGFPDEFADSPELRDESEEYISGPIVLPPLRDFQEEVMEGIRNLINGCNGRRRAVVSLPTGGGKTRVTVQAAVLLILKPVSEHRSVIWIAQTNELCEQAVQAFRQVWLNRGAEKTDLRIIRLWGGNPNPAIQEQDKPVAVVTSIQTLNSRMGANGLAWLQNPGLVIVDECHHAITPSYTNLLRWLDADKPHLSESGHEEPPIIGLSATPFRMDDEESLRLAKRFDKNLLPANQEQLHERLKSKGVLTRMICEPLESGVGLLPEEIEKLSALPEPWEGLNFENMLEAINQRLAGNKFRNERLVQCIHQANERSVLFFANSVAHAHEISARLNLAGISAAVISGSTPPVARRYFLDRFQSGKIRVLCNHSVLTTGFDAPRTDMVLIARQVFSRVRYMQMVGRGMRGKEFGGTECCRLVTVVDNLGRFKAKHPYEYFQWYFTGGCHVNGQHLDGIKNVS